MFCVTPLVKFHLVVGQAIYVLVVFLLLQNVIIDALVAYVRKTIKKEADVYFVLPPLIVRILHCF